MIPKKSMVVICCFFIAAFFVTGCVEQVPAPSEENFVLPEVTLDRVEVAHYWGWWYFKNTVEPTMGDAGNYGAPLDLAFIFDINNTNKYPVKLDELLPISLRLSSWASGGRLPPQCLSPFMSRRGPLFFPPAIFQKSDHLAPSSPSNAG